MRTDGCDQRSLTMYRLSSGTGREVSSTSRVGPRLVSTQAANSAALAMVADKPDQLDVAGGVDDDLLPHRPPRPVLEVVDLVEDHHPEPIEVLGPGVDHVA